jgi:LemA protein
MLTLIILLVIAALLCFVAIGIYNRLVALKHGVATAWSNIDVLLKQRHDELPKLVETCRQYMSFEQETLARVIAARGAVQSARESGDVTALGSAEGMMRGALGKLFALAEAYPDLKAMTTFQQLQTRISALETGIADRRELYNEAVNVNNATVEQFPNNLLAGLFDFKQAQLLQFDSAQTADVDVRALFG